MRQSGGAPRASSGGGFSKSRTAFFKLLLTCNVKSVCLKFAFQNYTYCGNAVFEGFYVKVIATKRDEKTKHGQTMRAPP
jgi:hypothetical protein